MILEDEPEEQDGIDYLTYVTVVEKDESTPSWYISSISPWWTPSSLTP